MSRRLFDFSLSEWQGSFPKEGESHYVFSAIIDKEGNSGSSKKNNRDFSVFCQSDPDQEFSRTVLIKTNKNDIDFDKGSYSVTELLKKLSSIYNSCSLVVKYDGTITGINNYLEIQKNWKRIKKDIEQDYKGSHIRMFTRSVDSRLETEQKMISDISSFENFGLLFHSIYGKYAGLSPVNKEFLFTGVKKVFPILENIKISKLTGKSVILSIENDDRSSDKIEYSGSYQINIINEWIEKASITTKNSYDGVEILSEFHMQQKV